MGVLVCGGLRLALRREPHERLVGVALLKVADAPRVQREDLVFQNPPELRLDSAFELDEVLRLLVAGKLRRLIPSRGRPAVLLRQSACIGDRGIAVHADVE